MTERQSPYGEPQKLTIRLPWPYRELSPNARVHWAEKGRASAHARADGYYATLEATQRWAWKDLINLTSGVTISCGLTFNPPDRRQRDQDNHVAMMKSYLDGICQALKIDDSLLQLGAPEWGEVEKGGSVTITLEVRA